MSGYLCPACGAGPALDAVRFRCDCGSPLDLAVDPTPYRVAGAQDAQRPLVADHLGGTAVRWALEGASATGSYKDRGAAALVFAAAAVGARRLVEDSSGNAGIALAAAAAHAGLPVTLFVPADARPEKPRLARALGAAVVPVEGPREAAAAAAEREAAGGAFYASHAWSPFFLQGVASLAYDLAGRLDAGDLGAVVVPCGNGGLVLGLHAGFAALHAAGQIPRPPALIAVQAEACAPLARAFARGETGPADGSWTATIADGIRVARPPRGAQTLRAVRETGGRFATVGEAEIERAWRWLWSRGLPSEPTSATTAALLLREAEAIESAHGGIVAVLSGSGLKGPTP